MQLDSRFREIVLLLLLTSPVSLFAAPYLSDSLQTTIAQCEEIQCQPVSCDNPITLDGQCCPICIEPGKGLSLSLYVTLFNTWKVVWWTFYIIVQMRIIPLGDFVADLTTGPRGCIYEGLNIPHGDHFHPPSMLQAYKENKSQNQTNASSTNPYCIECSCNVRIIIYYYNIDNYYRCFWYTCLMQ